jgi:hypothetical protein
MYGPAPDQILSSGSNRSGSTTAFRTLQVVTIYITEAVFTILISTLGQEYGQLVLRLKGAEGRLREMTNNVARLEAAR